MMRKTHSNRHVFLWYIYIIDITILLKKMLTRHIFCQAELFMLLWVFPLKSVYRNDSVFIQKMNWFEWFPTAIVFPKLQPLMINWAFMDKITRQRANDIWGLSVGEKQSHLLSIKMITTLYWNICVFLDGLFTDITREAAQGCPSNVMFPMRLIE